MKILYVGPVFPGGTAMHRMEALRALACDLTLLNTELPPVGRQPGGSLRSLLKRSLNKTDVRWDWNRIHKSLEQLGRTQDWDVLWVDKGLKLRPSVLAEFKENNPNCCLLNYSPDDMFNPVNQTARYLDAFPIYDLYVTTKSFNVAELYQAGAAEVIFVGNAYEPSIHRPMALTESEKDRWQCDVCFVGGCEPERQASIEFLARNGINTGVFGPWSHLAGRYENLRVHDGFFADQAYAKALCAGKIGLGFLRKVNRDLQTTRSVELPACGVFMLAERTGEHLEMFAEGSEAEFFSSDDELLGKVRFYLAHEGRRKEIAAAGRKRCIRSGYSNMERLRPVLQKVEEINVRKTVAESGKN